MSQLMEEQQLQQCFQASLNHLGDTVAYSVRLPTGNVFGWNADAPIEAGSAFKVLVLAGICELIDRGEITPAITFTLTPDHRVPASEAFEQLPDGTEISLTETLRAMIGVSDNTATQIAQGLLGPTRLAETIRKLGMVTTATPSSVREMYAADTTASQFWGFRTTVKDLLTCYERLLANDLALGAEAAEIFWSSLAAEDEEQGVDWGEGVRCFRKSGAVIVGCRNSQAIAGILRRDDTAIPFAIAINRAPGGDDAAATDFGDFNPQIGGALKLLSSWMRPVSSPDLALS